MSPRREPAWTPRKAEIIAAYRDGTKVALIHERFGIANVMLYELLHRESVPLRAGGPVPWWQGGPLLP
jgi:hypothetical protein